jgi:hypothetical protein
VSAAPVHPRWMLASDLLRALAAAIAAQNPAAARNIALTIAEQFEEDAGGPAATVIDLGARRKGPDRG